MNNINDLFQPRHSKRGTREYGELLKNISAPTPHISQPDPIFTMTITATSQKGNIMNEEQFLIDLVFKPLVPDLKLRPQETQLLLAYLGEILKEMESEEALIVKETKAITERETTSCK